jgi:hypothetical protein
MKTNLSDTPLILSASRTKDMVHRCPDLLADILLGKAPCRWGPHAPTGWVNPASLHTVVLWTKDPHNLLDHTRLKIALQKLREEYDVQIALELTATGLAGTFMEPGIAPWLQVRDTLAKILADGLIACEAIVYRYDPFLSVRSASGEILSNAEINLFRQVCGAFLDLGIRRVTTSRADAVSYPKVVTRFTRLGLEWIAIPDDDSIALCREMDDFCHSRGAEFSVCCNPPIPDLSNRFGCIDAVWLNRIKGSEFPPATEISHNKIGKQRPDCHCTYSRDIGYSTGSQNCYSGGFGCLYCYAAGNAIPPSSSHFP